jgi:hypothetical protein
MTSRRCDPGNEMESIPANSNMNAVSSSFECRRFHALKKQQLGSSANLPLNSSISSSACPLKTPARLVVTFAGFGLALPEIAEERFLTPDKIPSRPRVMLSVSICCCV